MDHDNSDADKVSKGERLLVVGPRVGVNPTGVAVAFEMLIEHLEMQGSDFRVINLAPRTAGGIAGKVTARRSGFVLWRVLEAWRHTPRASRVYLIVATSLGGFMRDFLVVVFAWCCRKPVILHLHGGGYRNFYDTRSALLQRVIKWTVSRATSIIVLGELLRDQFDFLDDPSVIHVVPNGLPTPRVEDQPAAPKSRPTAPNPWNILFLSNLMESKGYGLLLDAAGILTKRGHNFRVDFCGAFVESVAESGKSQQLARDFTRRIDDESTMTYHGTVSGDEKQGFLDRAHVFVLPTSYPWEGQPISIIEAMACGTPVVSTRLAGIPEQVDDGTNGLLLDNATAGSVADALDRLMSVSDSEYEAMSGAAIVKVQSCFTSAGHLARMNDVLFAD